LKLADQQSLRIAELLVDYRVIGVDRSAPFVRKPTGQIMRIGRVLYVDQSVRESEMPQQTQIDTQAVDTQAGGPTYTQPESVDLILRLQQLEGSTQAVLATLRRSLIEKVPPTRDGLAREAAIAFDLEDDQQALDMIDEIAQTVGISGFE
jgi:hypothetical protein